MSRELARQEKAAIRKLVTKWCANYDKDYPSEIAALQKDYADLWEPLSELLKKLSAVVSL